MKKGIFYVLLTAVLFTTLEPVSKLIATQTNPIAITFIRFFIGGLVLLPFAISKVKKDSIQISKKDYINMGLLGVLSICVSMVLLQYAVSIADSPALIAIIFSSNSVFTVLFSALILKDKITFRKAGAILLCVVGVLISANLKSETNLLSVVLAGLAALSFSLYTVLGKKLMTRISGIVQISASFVIGSLVLLIALLFMRIPIIGGINGNNIFQLLYLGFFVTGIGYWSYFKGMESWSTMAASLVFFIKPIITPFATFFINGIIPDVKVFITLVLILSGSYLVASENKQGSVAQSKAGIHEG